MFGNYYAFDNPSALNRLLRGVLAPMGDEKLFQYRLSLMYSVYSVPNIVLPFFVGRWLSRFGNRRVLIILSLLVTAGQSLVAFGIGRKHFGLALAGRIVFGLGGESLAVAQSRLVTEWFEGRELALALGLNLSIARIGTVVNNMASPAIATRWSVAIAFWMGFLSCLLSFGCTIATTMVDNCFHPTEHSRGTSKKYPLKDRWGFHPVFWLLALLCFFFYVQCILHDASFYHLIELHDSLQQCGFGLFGAAVF